MSVFSFSQATVPVGGNVTIFEGEQTLASGTLKDGSVKLPLSFAEGSTHTLTIGYSGDANYLPATRAIQRTAAIATTTTIEGPTAATYSTPAQFVAIVRTASGQLVNGGVVVFRDANRPIGSALVQSGQAVIGANLDAGTRSVAAYYMGSDAFRMSLSSAIQVQVSRQATSINLTTSSDFIATGAKLKLRARVDPGPISGEAGGSVVFKDGKRTLGLAWVVDGVATLSTVLPRGNHTTTAVFTGTSNYEPSTSNSVSTNVASFTLVDLMIVYTEQALNFAGSQVRIRRLIADSVSSTNSALINSHIPLTIRLRYSGQVDYHETGKLDTDLTRLARTNDGFMDNIHRIRNQVGADLVTLLESDGDFGGTAIELRDLHAADNPARGFSVVLAGEAGAPYYTLAHELGHNLGATHDAGNNEGRHGATSFSNGWRFRGKDGVLYHDIMSYDPGETIPYFSNPRIKYQGVPIGDPRTADSARTITLTAPYVAAYRRPGRVLS